MFLVGGQVTQTFAGDAVEEDEGSGDADFQWERGVGEAAAELLPALFLGEDGAAVAVGGVAMVNGSMRPRWAAQSRNCLTS